MMFKDEYKRTNDALHASPELLASLRRRQGSTKRSMVLRATAALAAIALVIGGALLSLPALTGSNRAADAIPRAADESALVNESVDEKSAESSVVKNAAELHPAKDYDEVYSAFNSSDDKSDLKGMGDMVINEVGVETSMGLAPTDSGINTGSIEQTDGVSDTDYSETNVQVSGVDEGDIVKTDGEFIYVLSHIDMRVYIIKAEGTDTHRVSTIELSDIDGQKTEKSEWPIDIYVHNDRLVIIFQGNNWSNITSADGIEYSKYESSAKVSVYNIADRYAPELLNEYEQSGNYTDSRLIQNRLYLVSCEYVYSFVGIDPEYPETFCPTWSMNGNEKNILPPGDIYVGGSENNNYTLVSCIDIEQGDSPSSVKALLGNCETVYCSGDRLLCTGYGYFEEQSEELSDSEGKHYVDIKSYSTTNLALFELNDGYIELVAEGELQGSLLNQFSIDEYDDHFRFVVTRDIYSQTIHTDGIDSYEYNNYRDNCLYITDASLELVSAVENLGQDERVKSARFMGDIGYFVTFRQIDPLFTVDISDPANPVILSELKIDGFSSYLHGWSDSLMLGIGYDADSENGRTQGVKLSMFDISDKNAVFEAQRLSIDADTTAVEYNHKAILVNAEKNIIAFPADDSYWVFSYDDGGFSQRGRIQLENAESFFFGGDDLRGLYIGDYFYVTGSQSLAVLDFASLKLLCYYTYTD